MTVLDDLVMEISPRMEGLVARVAEERGRSESEDLNEVITPSEMRACYKAALQVVLEEKGWDHETALLNILTERHLEIVEIEVGRRGRPN